MPRWSRHRWTLKGRKAGFNILARAYEIFTFPFVGLGTSVKKITERPDEVKRTIKALVRANRFIRDNRDESIQILAQWGRSERSAAAAAYDSSVKVFNRRRRDSRERPASGVGSGQG